jgi:hypothetical protein
VGLCSLAFFIDFENELGSVSELAGTSKKGNFISQGIIN